MGEGISTETMRSILKLRSKMPTRPWVFTSARLNGVEVWTMGSHENRITVGTQDQAIFLQNAAEFIDSIVVEERTLKAVDEAHVKKLNAET